MIIQDKIYYLLFFSNPAPNRQDYDFRKIVNNLSIKLARPVLPFLIGPVNCCFVPASWLAPET